MTNDLTKAQGERLAMLTEECGEAIQAASKVLRFGYDKESYASLMEELSNIASVVELMHRKGDYRSHSEVEWKEDHIEKKLHYSFHQNEELPENLREID